MIRPKKVTALEVIALVFFGIIAFISLGFMLISLAPADGSSWDALSGIPLCLGPLAGSLGAMLMVWLRNRLRPVKPLLASALVMWFVGITTLGFGLFAALNPGDNTIASNLGFSIALCFMPGGVFTLLSLLLYGYTHRGGKADQIEAQERLALAAEREDADLPYADVRRRVGQYRRAITGLVRARRGTAFEDRFSQIPEKLKRWEARVDRLVTRLRAYEADQVIQGDLAQVPGAIIALRAELAEEDDSDVRDQMADTLAGYEAHQAQLDLLTSLMRRTRLLLDDTLTAMGTVYSQLQLVEAMDVDSTRANRITAEIDDQVDGLSDLLSAMGDVYGVEDDDLAGAIRGRSGRKRASTGGGR
jgi:hypothetical protein